MIPKIFQEAIEESHELANHKTHALIAYGSHIAGYARPDSDYDFLTLVEDFKEKVRYYYRILPSGVPASFLVVDKVAFERDVESAFLGEFVAGRLYGPYKALINPSYIKAQEKTLKLRTMSEELIELYGEFEYFLPNLLIPLSYFLFSKLKKRMALYPPVKYSYQKTFFGPKGKENISSSLKIFEKATAELAYKGILEVVHDDIKIVDPRVSKARLEKFLLNLSLIYRGVKAYLIHAWAGKVSPKVVMNELRSKLSREEEDEVSNVLKAPYSLIRLEDPRVNFYYDESPIEKVLEDYLRTRIEIVKKERLAGILSLLQKIMVVTDGGVKSYVLKRYSDVGLLKWGPVDWWASPVEFSTYPNKRLASEYRYLLELKKRGFNVPDLIAVFWGDRSLVREYVEGVPLSDILTDRKSLLDFREVECKFGKELARLHGRRIFLGDSKPQNILVNDEGEIFFTDLEQANDMGDPAWDISLFLFYGAKFSLQKDRILSAAEAFIEGYLQEGEKENIVKAASDNYVRIFIPFVLPEILKALTNLCRSRSSK